MNKYIATWVYLDSIEEKSYYPNTGRDSASQKFQAIYWRCIVLFYETSLRFHKEMKHLFFTNTDKLPVVDGFNIREFFTKNNIQVIVLKNLYPLPDNYFSSFRNQFFEFSIVDHISKTINSEDMLILLDSDCVFAKSIDSAFTRFAKLSSTAMTYVVNNNHKYEMHGLSGSDMRDLFADFGHEMSDNPFYSGGELLFAKGSFMKYVAKDFVKMYDNLIERHQKNKLKFNEEAQVLSFYYYKSNAVIGGMNDYIKRLWTNRNYYRNVLPKDRDLAIWHLPNEKRDGIHNLFTRISTGKDLKALPEKEYSDLLHDTLLLASNHKIDYYKMLKSYIVITLQRLKIVGK